MRVVKYEIKHEIKLISLLMNESDWRSFVKEESIKDFKEALLISDTYILENNDEVYGYVRSLVDPFGVYISELYVCPAHRNMGFGRDLLNRVKSEHSNKDVYVLSDEDEYYKKLGFNRVGSVFQL